MEPRLVALQVRDNEKEPERSAMSPAGHGIKGGASWRPGEGADTLELGGVEGTEDTKGRSGARRRTAHDGGMAVAGRMVRRHCGSSMAGG
jgi:hypothetical protein